MASVISELKGTQSGPGLFLLLAKCHSGVTRLFSKVTGRPLRVRALILPPPLYSKAPARHGKETVLGKDSGLTQIVRKASFHNNKNSGQRGCHRKRPSHHRTGRTLPAPGKNPHFTFA